MKNYGGIEEGSGKVERGSRKGQGSFGGGSEKGRGRSEKVGKEFMVRNLRKSTSF